MSTARRPALFPALIAILAPVSAALGANGNVDFPRFPSISPDGKNVAFTWRGDVWSVPATGGLATRLTSHPALDLRTAWSPDGSKIAFNSARLGGLNVFTMNPDGTGVQPVTQTDRALTISAFSADAQNIWFSSSREGDVYRAVRPYRVPVAGGPIERLMDCFGENPVPSPDGTKVLFERGGSEWSRRNYRGPDSRDLWLYDVNTKAFTRLTTWAGNDGKGRWKDNSTVLFLSDRELDTVNVWAMTLEGGESKARRLTNLQGNDVHDIDAASDTCVFSAWDTLYTLNLRDASPTAKPLTVTASEDESDNFTLKNVGRDSTAAALSPDGKTMAVIAYGQVYVRATEEKSPTRRVTPMTASGRCRELAWSPDGVTLYFSSDEDGGDALFAATVAQTRDEVKDTFKKESKPQEKKAEEAAKPEEAKPAEPKPDAPKEAPKADDSKKDEKKEEKKDDKKKDDDTAKQAERWSKAIRFKVEPVNTGRAAGMSGDSDRAPAPSPDGKSLAFRRNRGDIMILDLAAGTTRRLVESWDYGIEFRWSPDSRFVAYAVSDDDFNSDVWMIRADASAPAVNLTRHPDVDGAPRFSADGKVLAFLSERNGDFDVYAVYLDKELESLSTPDLEKYYKDAADAAKKRKPLNHEKKKDAKDADAKKDESKKDEPKKDAPKPEDPKPADPKTTDPAAAPATPEAKPEPAKQDEPKKDEAKKEEPKADEKPFEPDLDDAYLRIRRITRLNGNESNLEITPAGERLIFTGNDGGDGGEGLYSVKWNGDDKERKRLVEGEPRVQHVSLTGDKVVYIDKGAPAMISPEGGKVDAQAIDDRQRVSLQAQAAQKFSEGARVLGAVFYHPTMKGLDWKAVSERYLALAKQTRTSEEFNYVGMRLVGELNASHLGFFSTPEPAPLAETCGRLGIDVESALAPGRVFRVKSVVPRGPASEGSTALKPGDLITAIDFEPFEPTDSIESVLRGKVGKEVAVTFQRQIDGKPDRTELTAFFTPIPYERETLLRYQWWCQKNADKVAEWSGGKLGYLHIRGMDEPSVVDFERDLYAAANAKAGLLVDVRNNGGGWTADRILASLLSPAHAYTVPRGGAPNPSAYPRDRLFITRYLKPVNMLCNEKSFSNAEIISHAFKHLKRGNLCGMTTYGGVISTDGTSLIDGTLVRLPFRGWYKFDGTDMENNGAVPDILTAQTPEDESSDNDRQLKAAVDDLLKRVQ